MRIIGLDLGSKTIGVAVSDELGISAQPLKVIPRRGGMADMQALAGLAAEYGVELVVLGLPLNMDGSAGPAAEKVREFGSRLEQATALKVDFWDERLTTASAERVLMAADVSRAKRKQVIDKMAASLILQGYLERQAVRRRQREA